MINYVSLYRNHARIHALNNSMGDVHTILISVGMLVMTAMMLLIDCPPGLNSVFILADFVIVVVTKDAIALRYHSKAEHESVPVTLFLCGSLFIMICAQMYEHVGVYAIVGAPLLSAFVFGRPLAAMVVGELGADDEKPKVS